MTGPTVTTTRRSRDTRLVVAALALLVVLGGALRLPGIDAGNPYVYHPDEWYLAKTGMVMVRELDPLPHFYQYPSLMPILSAVVVAAVHGLGGPTLETGQPWLLEREVLPEQFAYFLATRLLVLLLGLATIVVVYLVGARLRDRTTGLVAAAIVTVSPLHVANSRFATTDVPLTLAGAVTLLVTIQAARDGRPRWWVAAGIAAGVAASTKWNGIALVAVPLLASFLTMNRAADLVRPARLVAFARQPTPWLIGAAALTTILAITPGLLIEWRTAGRNFLQLGRHYGEAEPYATVDSLSYAAGALAQGVGPLVLLAALAGLALVASRPRPRGLPITAFVAAYFLVVAFAPRQYERNLLLLLPFLAVAAGYAVAELRDRLPAVASRRPDGRPAPALGTLAAAGWLALALVPGTIAQAQAALLPAAIDTRAIAADWIRAHLPAGSAIAREVYTPQVGPEYRVQQTFYLADLTLDEYRRRGIRYLVASDSAHARFVGEGAASPVAAFYAQLFQLPELGRIEPGPGQQGPRIQVFELTPE